MGLIIAYSKPSESEVSKFYSSQVDPFYQRPVGFGHLAASGIQAQRYINQNDVSTADLAAAVVRRWKDAADSDKVQISDLPDEAAVLAATNAARPLTSLMMARPVDGAVAVLLASEDIARKVSRTPVWITGKSDAIDHHAFAARTTGRLEACDAAAGRAFKQAGWKKTKKASIAEVSASSVVTEAMVLESLGIAKDGAGLDPDNDKTTINRSGGSLPADPIMATGLVRLSEAVQQLSQPELYGLKAPTSAIVHGAGGVGMQTHCVFTLEV